MKEKKEPTNTMKGIAGLVVLVILIVIGILTMDTGETQGTHSKKSSPVTEWYEGGTLHKSNVKDWRKATEQNKLATCGDFMARYDDEVSIITLKSRAIDLRACINEAIRDVPGIESQDVSSMAALCAVQLGY